MTILRTGPDRTRVLRLGRGALLLRPRVALVNGCLAAALLVAIVASLSVSVNFVPPAGVLAALTGHGTPAEQLIVVHLRLPRAIVGALVGLGLGVAGSLFQSVTRNPLGSPDVIGFDVGASTCALVFMLFVGRGAFGTALGAVIGGIVTALVVLSLARRHHGIAPLRLVLIGIGVAGMLSAVNSLLAVSAELYDAQSAAVWLVGNLAGSDAESAGLLAPVVVVGLALALLLARPLALSELADDRSASLGLRPERVRLWAIAIGVLLASASVAAAGPIAFIALAAPQLARRLTGASGPNILAAGLTGAVLLVLTDLAAREAFQPRQLPAGVLTGVVGGLYLIWLLGREWRKGRA